MSAPSTPTSMLTTPEVAQTTINENEILVQEGALNTNTVVHMAIEPTHMSGMAARKKQVQINMVKAVEAVYVFHVGDWDTRSTRQLAETVRNKTTQIALDADMKFTSNPADLMLGGIRSGAIQLEREKTDPMNDMRFKTEHLRVVREGLDCGNTVLALPEACKISDIMRILSDYEMDWCHTKDGLGMKITDIVDGSDGFNLFDLALATDTRSLKWKQGPNGDRFDHSVVITMAPVNESIGKIINEMDKTRSAGDGMYSTKFASHPILGEPFVVFTYAAAVELMNERLTQAEYTRQVEKGWWGFEEASTAKIQTTHFASGVKNRDEVERNGEARALMMDSFGAAGAIYDMKAIYMRDTPFFKILTVTDVSMLHKVKAAIVAESAKGEPKGTDALGKPYGAGTEYMTPAGKRSLVWSDSEELRTPSGWSATCEEEARRGRHRCEQRAPEGVSDWRSKRGGSGAIARRPRVGRRGTTRATRT